MEAIGKTLQPCYLSVYVHAPFLVSKYRHDKPIQSLGSPYLYMGFNGKIVR